MYAIFYNFAEQNIPIYQCNMKTYKTIQTYKNSFSFSIFGIAVAALTFGLLISLFPAHRQYFPAVSQKDNGEDEDAGAKGEAQFFFNARKNPNTNAMDYSAMLAADIADRAMLTAGKKHSAMATMPNYNWTSLGPTNIGGRTRGIIIDNTDPTHQTLFAGGVSGGIWKSTNGGGTWDNYTAAVSYSLNDNLSNMNVCCLAQDSKGAIYAGTGEGFLYYNQGEGFSTSMLGGGIFKSTDDGKTWRVLSATVPTPTNKDNTAWAYVNRIAIRPDNPLVIYAATNKALMVSHDSGATWAYAVNSAGNRALDTTSNVIYSHDVEISADGSIVIADAGGTAFYCYPQSGPDNTFTKVTSSGAGHLPIKGSRIEFGISPTDPNRIYASYINASGHFYGTAGATSGIFMTMNAVTSGNGGYWYEIGPGGTSFDPYAEPGAPITDDQPTYDNTLGVPPANEAQVLCGGTTLWEWSGQNLTDTVGAWNEVYQYSYIIHPDLHAIVFDRNNPRTVYIGCDGGIYKSTNYYIDPTNVDISIPDLAFYSVNRNYNVTQYYTVCYAPYVDSFMVAVSTNDGAGIDSVKLKLNAGGGTQDNGSPFINGALAAGYPLDAADLSGGDGSGAVVSTLNPNIAYFCADYGTLRHEGSLPTLSTTTSAYTKTLGKNEGVNIDSIFTNYGADIACFVFPVALYENSYDTLNHDSLVIVAAKSYSKGDTIWPTSNATNLTYPYVLTKAYSAGDSITVPDRVVSRLAIGSAPVSSRGGIFMTGQAASSGTVIWMPIAGPLSTPTPFVDNGGAPQVHALAWTPDGNTLFAGTEDGVFFRFSNINSIVANNYKTGGLWSVLQGGGVFDTTNQVVSNSLTAALGVSGRDILYIAVDPNNGNNILVTLGNYGSTNYIYYSNNALSANPSFKSVQGNLPDMPVYGAILDILDSTGTYMTNAAMVATEHGIYTTSNVTLGTNTQWTKNSNGLPNVLTLAIEQQRSKPWLCNNEGVIYAGTHGRGIWSSNQGYNVPTAVHSVTASANLNSFTIYPNPMTIEGNMQYTISSASNIVITIYDMQGNEVKTMNLGTQSPGVHLVTFETAGMREGPYFAALTGNGFRKVNKFIVVR